MIQRLSLEVDKVDGLGEVGNVGFTRVVYLTNLCFGRETWEKSLNSLKA